MGCKKAIFEHHSMQLCFSIIIKVWGGDATLSLSGIIRAQMTFPLQPKYDIAISNARRNSSICDEYQTNLAFIRFWGFVPTFNLWTSLTLRIYNIVKKRPWQGCKSGQKMAEVLAHCPQTVSCLPDVIRTIAADG